MAQPTLDCPHPEASEAGRVCCHLLATGGGDYYQHFSGRGLAFHLICSACRRNIDSVPGNLRAVCRECLERVRAEGSWDGTAGLPEVRERPSGLSFRHERIRLADALGDRILDIQPIESVDRNLWVAVTQAGQLLRLDLDDGSVAPLFQLHGSGLDLSEALALHLSNDGRLAAVVNTHGQHGVVVDLAAGKTTLSLERDNYQNEHCTFPVAFCEAEGRPLLIHATAWNRLDVSDPGTGTLLTGRSLPAPQRGGARPAHDLDYFHCGLAVSPGGKHVVDNGWVWHPVGVVVTWDVAPWLNGNVWESEDGPSKKHLCHRTYYWDGPLCWVGEDRLAVWGYGEDDEWLIPAVRLFDVARGSEERWFPGPKGRLVFDDYLVSFDETEGTSVWDVDTGERLLRQEAFCPLRYHRGAKSFLTPGPDGSFQVSRLRGRCVDPDWLSAHGGRVARLARAVAEARAFDTLPVLADALEEAGCQDATILGHCRRPGPHTHGCWVLDRLLDGP